MTEIGETRMRGVVLQPRAVRSAAARFLAFALAMLGVAIPLAAKSVKPLPGIVLVTNGPSIVLSWNPKSPLGQQLGPRAMVEVVATYDSAAGLVQGEPVAAAVTEYGSTVLKFDLPRQLRNAPSGPVCLRLRYGRNQSIPLRVPNAGESSDGFAHAKWEKSVAIATRRAELEREKSRLDASIAALESMSAPFERWKSERSFADAAACESIPTSAPSKRPATAIAGNAQIAASQYHCVGLFAIFVGELPRSKIDAKSFAAELSAALRHDRAAAGTNSRNFQLLDERIAGIDQLTKMIAAYPEATGPDFMPLLQTFGLSLTSESESLISRNGGKADSAVASALLDSFGSCLSESRSQFELSYQNWQASMSPALLEKRAEVDRKDCRVRFSAESDRLRELAAKQQKNVEVASKLQQAGEAQEVQMQAQTSLIASVCGG